MILFCFRIARKYKCKHNQSFNHSQKCLLSKNTNSKIQMHRMLVKDSDECAKAAVEEGRNYLEESQRQMHDCQVQEQERSVVSLSQESKQEFNVLGILENESQEQIHYELDEIVHEKKHVFRDYTSDFEQYELISSEIRMLNKDKMQNDEVKSEKRCEEIELSESSLAEYAAIKSFSKVERVLDKKTIRSAKITTEIYEQPQEKCSFDSSQLENPSDIISDMVFNTVKNVVLQTPPRIDDSFKIDFTSKSSCDTLRKEFFTQCISSIEKGYGDQNSFEDDLKQNLGIVLKRKLAEAVAKYIKAVESLHFPMHTHDFVRIESEIFLRLYHSLSDDLGYFESEQITDYTLREFEKYRYGINGLAKYKELNSCKIKEHNWMIFQELWTTKVEIFFRMII